MDITYKQAEKMIEAACKKAEAMKLPENIAVVDKGGNLVAFKRMDGAMIAGIDIAINKAYTAAATMFPTDGLGQVAQPGQPAYGCALSDKGRLIIFAGGLPVKSGNEVVGGIGAAGGMAPDDKKVAEAGLAAFK